MKLDMDKLYGIASQCRPRDLKPVTVQRSGGPMRRCHCDIDTVFNQVRSKHVIHLGLRIELEIILYGILKALSLLFDRDDPTEPCDYWPAIDNSHFEEATKDWKTRSEMIGDELVELLKNLKDLGFLKIYRLDRVVYFQLTSKMVSLILQSVGISIPRELISD